MAKKTIRIQVAASSKSMVLPIHMAPARVVPHKRKGNMAPGVLKISIRATQGAQNSAMAKTTTIRAIHIAPTKVARLMEVLREKATVLDVLRTTSTLLAIFMESPTERKDTDPDAPRTNTPPVVTHTAALKKPALTATVRITVLTPDVTKIRARRTAPAKDALHTENRSRKGMVAMDLAATMGIRRNVMARMKTGLPTAKPAGMHQPTLLQLMVETNIALRDTVVAEGQKRAPIDRLDMEAEETNITPLAVTKNRLDMVGANLDILRAMEGAKHLAQRG